MVSVGSLFERLGGKVSPFRRKSVIPFIVVGMPRTGSTLLLSSLQSHPNLIVYEELFHFVESERAIRHAIARCDEYRYFNAKEGDALKFLRSCVFAPPRKDINAIGLKIFAEFVKCSGTRDMFPRLRDQISGLRIIHVIRRNYLDVLVSRALARVSGRWEERIGAAPIQNGRPRHEEIGLTLSADIAREFFQAMARADKYFNEIFSSSIYTQVYYDLLSTQTTSELSRIFHFLDQKTINIEVGLKKQNNATSSEVIVNYNELRDIFLGGEFGQFFTEPAETPPDRLKVFEVPRTVLPSLSI